MNEMCDFLGKSHEFFLALKKAGFTDEKIQRIISSKDNALAKSLFKAYEKAVKNDNFKLIFETVVSFSSMAVLNVVKEEFNAKHWGFDNALLSSQEPEIDLGLYKAKIYQPKEALPFAVISEFIKKNGIFPGAFGMAAFLNENLKNNSAGLNSLNIPLGLRVFSLRSEKMVNPYIVKFKNQYLDLYFGIDKPLSLEKKISSRDAFLLFEKINKQEACFLVEDLDLL